MHSTLCRDVGIQEAFFVGTIGQNEVWLWGKRAKYSSLGELVLMFRLLTRITMQELWSHNSICSWHMSIASLQ